MPKLSNILGPLDYTGTLSGANLAKSLLQLLNFTTKRWTPSPLPQPKIES